MKKQVTAERQKDHQIRQIINGLRAITSAERRLSKRLSTTSQITARQLGVIRIVAQTPGISLGELSARMYLHISTSSAIVDRLQKRRLLVRERRSEDGRVMQLRVTSKGLGIIRDVPITGFGFLMRDIRALSPGEIRTIWVGMKGLLKLLRMESDLARAARME